MRKIMNIVIGGIQQKIFNVFLLTMLLVMGAYTVTLIVASTNLNQLVGDTGEKQKESIRVISESAMSTVVTRCMEENTALRAGAANEVFQGLRNNVQLLGDYARVLFSNRESEPRQKVELPDAGRDGEVSVQLITEAGVDAQQEDIADTVGLIGNMSDMLCALLRSMDVNSCFVATPDGVLVIADDRSGSKFNDKGELLSLPVRERPWYTGAVSAGEMYFTDVERDAFTDKVGIVCALPVYADGQLVCIVGADLFLDFMEETVNGSEEEGSFLCVMNEKGHIIFSPESEGIFEAKISEQAEDLRKSEETELADFAQDVSKGETKMRLVTVGGKEYYMSGAVMDTVGWSVLAVVDRLATEETARLMEQQFEQTMDEASQTFYSGLNHAKTGILLLLVVIFVLCSAGSLLLAKRIVKPLGLMTKRVASLGGNHLQFMMEDDLRTGDEIEVLAEAFAKLSKKTLQYVDEVTKATAERERVGAELSVATTIQNSMLPNLFPDFTDVPEYDMFASMSPAREVGGDFYDFFMVDPDHLAVLIADVSDKGVGAALFMAISKSMIKMRAQMGGSPAEVISYVDKRISETNDAGMFVTLWLGYIDLNTGHTVACNAGHDYPAIACNNGDFVVEKSKHGSPIAFLPGMPFPEIEFDLKPGDRIVLYTDGVPEAKNPEGERFGVERMVEVLNANRQENNKTTLEKLREAVNTFAGEEPQFDDMTMLGITYYGRAHKA